MTDIDGLVSMRDKKFMHTIAAVPESATLGDDPATEPVQRENKSRPERAASARRFTRLQEAGSAGEQDRMFNSLCSCLTIIMVYAVVISLAFIVVSALYATASPGFNCESVKKVGKV